MQETNSFVDQARNTQEISMQQLQLAELQKISAQLNAVSLNSTLNTPVSQTVPNVSVDGTLSQPTNMTTIPGSHMSPANVYSPPDNTGKSLFNASVEIGGLALSAGVNTAKGGVSIAQAAKNRVVGFVNAMENSPFFAYQNIDWTRTSTENAELLQLQSEQRFQNAAFKVGSTGVNMAGSALGASVGTMIMPVIGTMAGAYIGGKLSDGITNQTMEQLGARQGYDQWLQKNSTKFIDAFESKDPHKRGFNRKEEESLSKWLMKSNGDFFMSDDEMFTMLNNVTDAGLMKSTSDAKDFKKKFSGLVNLVKDGAKMLNTSYEEMTAMISEMNKMGIKDNKDRLQMLGMTDVTSMITGKDSAQAFNAQMQVSQAIAPGTMIDPKLKMETAGVQISKAEKWKEDWKQFDPDAQNAINAFYNLYNGDTSALAMGMNQMQQQVMGNDIVKYGVMAAATAEKDGTLKLDEKKMEQMLSAMQNGTITYGQLHSEAAKNLSGMGIDAAARMDKVDAAEVQAMMLEAYGSDSKATSMINQIVASLSKGSNMSTEAGYQQMFGLSAAQAEIMNHFGGKFNDKAGAAIEEEQKALAGASVLRNKAESQLGLNPFERAKYKIEDIYEGIAGLVPSFGTAFDGVKDWWLGTDSASRAGYKYEKGVDVAKGNYNKAFDKISKESKELKKIDKEFKLDLQKDFKDGTKKDGILDKITGGLDTISDVILSPSRWGEALSFSKYGAFTTTKSSGGESVEKIYDKIKSSKSLSDKEKDSAMSQIDQITGQTQNMVSSSLDVVTALGGSKARESMKDRITIDKVTKHKTGAREFDDFADEKVLNKMSLSDQKRIQEMAVNQAVKEMQLEFKSDKKKEKLRQTIEETGLDKTNKKVANALKGSITDKDIKVIVQEMMTEMQAGNKNLSYSKLLDETGKSSDRKKKDKEKEKVQDSLEEINKTYGSMNKEFKKLIEQQNDSIKMMSGQINDLQLSMSSKGYRKRG